MPRPNTRSSGLGSWQRWDSAVVRLVRWCGCQWCQPTCLFSTGAENCFHSQHAGLYAPKRAHCAGYWLRPLWSWPRQSTKLANRVSPATRSQYHERNSIRGKICRRQLLCTTEVVRVLSVVAKSTPHHHVIYVEHGGNECSSADSPQNIPRFASPTRARVLAGGLGGVERGTNQSRKCW